MAKSLDKQEEQTTSPYPAEDVELAVRMGVKLLNEGGLQVIKEAIDQSQDPAQVVGSFLAQIMGTMAEQLQNEAGIDPGLFLAPDGFLDAILNYIEEKLGYPAEFSDQIYNTTLEVIKAAAKNPPAEQQGAAPPQPGAPAPAQAPAPPAAGGY